MSNGWRIFRTSVYYPFAVRLLSDVSNDKCSCALFVHWNIFAQIVNQTFVHKQLTNILDVSLLSVCAQTVDEYFGQLFAFGFHISQLRGESVLMVPHRKCSLAMTHLIVTITCPGTPFVVSYQHIDGEDNKRWNILVVIHPVYPTVLSNRLY